MSDSIATMEAERAATSQADAFELLLKPEYQEALHDIVEQLPKLAVVMSLFGKLYDVASEALTDGELMGSLEELLRQKTQPIKESYANLSWAAKEAKERAESETAPIGVFGILRMLKDPMVQKNLKLVSAFLSVMGERSKTTAD